MGVTKLRILICVDDTDNREAGGTGDLALKYKCAIADYGWGSTSPITRHQLYVHADIPYTSHNSAMCFGADIADDCLEKVIDFGQAFLTAEAEDGSDPGLCVVVSDRLASPKELVDFGRRAKRTVLTKEEAYGTAARLGVHLSEHGGTGGGVIGALAGAGLHLSGSDGRVKGKYYFSADRRVVTVREICDRTNVEEVRTENRESLGEDETVRLGKKIKSVYLDGKIVLLVEPAEDGTSAAQDGAKWVTLAKEKLKNY
jgi:hypothetical protein